MQRAWIRAASIATLALCGLCAGPALATTNLLLDGDFETPVVTTGGYSAYSAGQSFGPWSVVGTAGTSNILLSSTSYSETGVVFQAENGSQLVDITGVGNTGLTTGIKQTLGTKVGQLYTLGFWVGYANSTNSTEEAGLNGAPSSVSVLINGTSIGTYSNSTVTSGGVNWKFFQATFTPATTTTTVEFLNATPSGNGFTGLDNVVLTAPEPGSWALMIVGVGFVGGSLRLSRRVPKRTSQTA